MCGAGGGPEMGIPGDLQVLWQPLVKHCCIEPAVPNHKISYLAPAISAGSAVVHDEEKGTSPQSLHIPCAHNFVALSSPGADIFSKEPGSD